jgi:streptogramin lyase
LARDGIWFTEYRAGMVTRLQPDLTPATTTPLSKQTMVAPRTTDAVVPSTFSVRPEVAQATTTFTLVLPTLTSGFSEFGLPDADSGPFGIAHRPYKGQIWYAASRGKKIGMLVPFDAKNYAFLPLILNHATRGASGRR